MDEQDRAGRAERARQVAAGLAADGVVAVALTWVDTSGITRVKTVPLSRLEHAAAWGVGMSPVFDAFLVDDSITAGRFAGGPVGDLRLLPDLDRLVPLSAQPGWAWAPVDRCTQQGEPHPQCARTFTRQMTTRLAAAGLSARLAFEIEWVVDAGDSDRLLPACGGPAYGMTRVVELSDYGRDLLAALAAQEVAVEQFHPEYAPGQLEISVAAADPVAGADTSVLVRQTIRAVARQHGLRCSFGPAVQPGGVGNGGHVHLSVWRDGRNLFAGGPGRYGLTGDGEAFAAGILAGLPALLAVGAPSVASYLRLVPQQWAGVFACWGLENREAALRLITGSVGSQEWAANLEVKCLDLAANPYLLAGVLLAAGSAGITDGCTLPDPVAVDPAGLSEADRAARGIRRLPTDLSAAVVEFEQNRVLRDALGDQIHDTIVAVRRAEIALFADATPEQVVAATRWRH